MAEYSTNVKADTRTGHTKATVAFKPYRGRMGMVKMEMEMEMAMEMAMAMAMETGMAMEMEMAMEMAMAMEAGMGMEMRMGCRYTLRCSILASEFTSFCLRFCMVFAKGTSHAYIFTTRIPRKASPVNFTRSSVYRNICERY